VPNNGSQDITVPSTNTMEGRIKVQPTGDYIFFDINNGDVIISEECLANGEQIFPSTSLIAEEGDSELILDMDYGTIFTSISESLIASDPNYFIAPEDQNMGTCRVFGNNPNYKVYSIKTTETGPYTFTKTGSIPSYLMNIYDPTFVTSSVCSNWVACSGNYNGTVIDISNVVSGSLTEFSHYELTFNGFNSVNTGSFTITPSGPGDVYFPGNPLPGFSYEYVVVNDATGNIDLIADNPDLTTFGAGNYTVHGLSFNSSENVQTYVGGLFTTLQNDVINENICANLSSNSRNIEIQQLMPLDFLHFEVERVESGAALQWSIANPVNVSHFVVQRLDPKTSEFIGFAETDFVDGVNTYSEIDPNIQPGETYFYRIQSVDHDGYSQLSPVRWMRTAASSDLVIFPNPTRNYFRIQGAWDKVEQMRVYDMLGRIVHEQNNLNSNRISTTEWPAGMYKIELFSGGKSIHLPLVIQ